MLYSNHCQFILTILLTTAHQNTKMHALPLLYHSTQLGLFGLSIVRCCNDDTVKCPYTDPVDWLTNTFTSQNTLHKRDLMLIYCALLK